MNNFSSPQPTDAWLWSESQLRDWQLQQLNQQFACTLSHNAFYAEKFGSKSICLRSLEELGDLPLTTKEELVSSAFESADRLSRHHTFPAKQYSRIHRTSGTTGDPLLIMDTAKDWQWWSDTWQHVLEAAEVTSQDRVFLAFSFGPFIGFWSAHQACIDRGSAVVPGGGLSTLARLEFMRQTKSTVVFCTPSYALHMAEVAASESFPLEQLEVRRIIVAGEAGGSVPAARTRIEAAWGAQVVDHAGATEIGPWGFGWADRPGLHVIESSFIPELLPIAEATAAETGLYELVLTSLGRYGAPVIRYRTGDVVRAEQPRGGECSFLWFPQGVVGRADSMVTVRGVNVFPSSIDALAREFPEITEYQVEVTRASELDQLTLIIEANPAVQAELEKRISVRLGLRIPVCLAEPGSLPRSELKSRRWIDKR